MRRRGNLNSLQPAHIGVESHRRLKQSARANRDDVASRVADDHARQKRLAVGVPHLQRRSGNRVELPCPFRDHYLEQPLGQLRQCRSDFIRIVAGIKENPLAAEGGCDRRSHDAKWHPVEQRAGLAGHILTLPATHQQ